MSAEPIPLEPINLAEYCRICGVDLENQRVPTATHIWTPELSDGETPRVDELCDICCAWAWIR